MNQSALANMQPLKDKLVDKIKSDFSELIPEEDWNKLVSEVTKDFIENDVEKYIKSELQKELESQFGQWVQANCSNWNSKNESTFKQILRDTAPDLVAGIFANMADQISFNITNNIKNGY